MTKNKAQTMQTGYMLESNNIRYKYSLERIRRVLKNVNDECIVGPQRFRFFSKSAFLCGGRAQVFVSLFRKLKEEDEQLFENATVVFLYAKNPKDFENIQIEPHLDKTISSFSDNLNFLPSPLATHAVVEVWTAGNVMTVDPTLGSIYSSTVKELREKRYKKVKLIDADINNYNEIKTNNINAPYRMYYATNFFYKTVVSQHYIRNVDLRVENYIKKKRLMRLIKC